MNSKKNLLKEIVKTCLIEGEFKLKSGEISKYYLDLRKAISYPNLMDDISNSYVELLKPIIKKRAINKLAAIPISAIPITTLISQKLKIPFIYPRLLVKPHGSGNPIEGVYNAGEKVVLIDDVITTAQSKMEAILILEEYGLKITDLVVFIDRKSNTKAFADLQVRGIWLHSFATLGELLEIKNEK